MTTQLANAKTFTLPQSLTVPSQELLAKSLDDAVATISNVDRKNHMLEKCVKFLATLRYLLQSSSTCQYSP